jgi:lipopolysaccharide export system protein LptA
MSKKNQFLLWALCFLFLPDLVSKDHSNFKNISILADQVTLIEEANEIIFIKSINIKIDGMDIKGESALMSLDDEKIEISGAPVSIKSSSLDGKADLLIIYPNQSIDMIGNATLLNDGNLISSNLIKYQIASDE